MARDVLAVPTSGVGVERIFNMARDICHYRRGRLDPETIRMLCIIKYYDRAVLLEETRTEDDDALTEASPQDIQHAEASVLDELTISSDEEEFDNGFSPRTRQRQDQSQAHQESCTVTSDEDLIHTDEDDLNVSQHLPENNNGESDYYPDSHEDEQNFNDELNMPSSPPHGSRPIIRVASKPSSSSPRSTIRVASKPSCFQSAIRNTNDQLNQPPASQPVMTANQRRQWLKATMAAEARKPKPKPRHKY